MELGTAEITVSGGRTLVSYVNTGSFLVGEQWFRTTKEAESFCRDRRLAIVRYR